MMASPAGLPNQCTQDEAVTIICTHRCAHFTTVIMSPDTCDKRRALLRKYPVVLGPSVYWYCKDCAGPLPLDAPIPEKKPRLPEFDGHEARVLNEKKTRVCKCVTCGTTDVNQFDRHHSRKCRACLKQYLNEKVIKRRMQRKQKPKESTRSQCCR